MRKEQLDNWIENGGELPENLTENEKDYLKSLGWKSEQIWHDNGQLNFEPNYLHGKLHGMKRGWHDNGQLSWEATYVHGKKHGVWRGWREDGELFRRKEYAYGVFLKDFLK
jgi:antitoxin component YwqK of YwqJK toxin-antitoxin module